MDLNELFYDDYDDDYYISNADNADYEIFNTDYKSLVDQEQEFGLLECMSTSILQIVSYVFNLAALNLFYRYLTQWTSSNSSTKHLYSAVTGYLSTFLFLSSGNVYLLNVLIISYLFQLMLYLVKSRKQGFLTLIFTILTLISFELFEPNVVLWHQIRGLLLIASMKTISYAFDLQNRREKTDSLPNPFEFFGYALCPANAVVGPWCSFNDYKQSHQNAVKITSKLIFQVAINALLAIVFALLSNCINFILSENSGAAVNLYRDAFGFRTSHYFISYMSQVQMMVAGFEATGKMVSKLGYQVTRPIDIEFPRSLVTVVISWNIPMHIFIKQYIFQNFRKFGNFVAILISYLISALLHGLNFQLGAVLLSLGLFSYTEYMLRLQLAEIFSCCIAAHPCKKKENGLCSKGHKHNGQKWFVMLINFLLGLITIFNLTYLGVMFEASFSIQEKGFSFYHAMAKWTELRFCGHIFMALCFSVHYILK